METRLDRLLNLLNTGSSAATRSAAAQQIGEIQKYHPYDLQKLLLRVHEFLIHEKWETRIAAGQAIASIASHVPLWNPEYDSSKSSEQTTNTGSLRFQDIDFNNVIQFGTVLLASEGAEYTESLELDNTDQDPETRLAHQKKQLEQRMGVTAKFMGLDEMLDINDFKSEPFTPNDPNEMEESMRKAADIADILHAADSSTLSARERNKMKRKAKEIAKTKENQRKLNSSTSNLRDSMKGSLTDVKKEFKTVITEQPQQNNTLVIEAVADQNVMINNENIWPFHLLSALLLNELFDPCWEVRHGSVVGLREILKIHSSGAGKTADATKEEQQEQNRFWLQDCCIRFLCVFALDRFGDYVSGDQVVVPVRETCAQAFGALMSGVCNEDALLAFHVLLDFLHSDKWEVRHGSLLGLKYLIAVRTDLLRQILPKAIEPVLCGLEDLYDDVRSVASDTLLPVAKDMATICSDQLPRLLYILWNILLDLDDLTASTNSVMNLLAKFYSIPESAAATIQMVNQQQSEGGKHPLTLLVPRLWPFLLHNIASVRLSTLKTLVKLFSMDMSSFDWLIAIVPTGMQYIFQTIILETKPDIIETAKELWELFLCKVVNQETLAGIESFIPTWLYLVSTPIQHPLPMECLIVPDFHAEDTMTAPGKRRRTENFSVDSKPPSKRRKADDISSGAVEIMDASSTAQIQSFCTPLMRDNGCDALGVLFSKIHPSQLPQSYELLLAYMTSPSSNRRLAVGLILESIGLYPQKVADIQLPEPLRQRVLTNLVENESFMELVPYTQKMKAEYQVLVTSMISFGAPAGAFPLAEDLNMKSVQHTATTQFEQFLFQLKNHIDDGIKGQLQARQQQLLATIELIKVTEFQAVIEVNGSMSSVLIAWNYLPEKLNPIIRSLMNAVKKENQATLQKRFACAIVLLTKLVVGRTPCPNSKIVANLCSLVVPNTETEAAKRSRKGGEYALQAMATLFKDSLFTDLPTLKDILLSIQTESEGSEGDIGHAKLTSTLELFLTLLPSISPGLFPFFLSLFSTLFSLVQSKEAGLRTISARVIATFCKFITLDCMKLVLSTLLPFLSKSENEASRLGVAEAIHYIIEYLEMDLIPYLVFLVVPTLGRMSDQCMEVRKLVTRSFATLVRLMPLESGVPDPAGFSVEMIQRKQEERKFLEQLLDGSKLDTFVLPIPVKAQLRQYQQEGLNWLAFLKKYHLHGILCDDMGLGKTLQTLCIIVSDNYTRKQNFEESGDPSSVVLPSMVVCPPTVVGHWFFEVKKFFEGYASAILYTGPPAERSALRSEIVKHDIVIMSYDILRNDISFLSKIYWNYCALDEGHIIRNSKTKITQAAKMVPANHRLILSGTPIQNNVLELWSLFDFLMPGFLGTEQQFNNLYGKPILASKDPKCSQRDQERGTLALEALHRQVLPFLLRRVKEDVLQDLPPKIIQDYYCQLSPLQKRLYEDFAQSPTCHTIQSKLNSGEEAKEQKKKGTHVFQALQYLRKLCNHPLLVLNARHPEYHSVMEDFERSGDTIHSIHHAPKLVALRELLIECGIGNQNAKQDETADLTNTVQHRVLLFAQLKLMLDIIESDLLAKFFPSVSYLRLDGGVNSNKRHDIVTKFNDDPTIDILLLTTHVGGLGLNLTGADTVIFVEHDWNPMKDLQAMDRAHRLGQTKVVNVYRLITRGTLEEKIMGLQKFKMNIANSVVNKENSSLRTMDTNQLLDLFDFNEDNKKDKTKDSSGVDELGNIQTASSGVNKVVETLEELWDDDSQYTEEYDAEKFVSSLKK